MRLDWILPALILSALAAGVALLVAARLGRDARPAARLIALVLALLATPLLWSPSRRPIGRLVWVQGLEPMGLQAAGVGIYLAVSVFWALFLAQMTPFLAHLTPFRRQPERMGYGLGLAYLITGLAAAALTIDHFLGRVVLLDLTSLLTALTLWLGGAPDDGSQPPGAWPHLARYLVFRLADMALLLMVLLLYGGSNTFYIDDMLAAALTLSRRRLLIAVLGGLLAAWIKLGLHPFHDWVEAGQGLPTTARVAALACGLPILGAYLLYRLRPLLAASGAIPPLALAGSALCAWGLFDLIHRRREGPLGRSGLLTTHAALGLILVGLPPMQLYLLTFLPLRIGFCLLATRAPAGQPVARAKARSFSLLSFLGRASDLLEERGLESLVDRLAAGVMAISSLSARVVESSLETLTDRLAEAVMALASLSARTLEDGLLEGLLQATLAGVRRLVWRLKRLHTGHLRRNLVWALVALVSLIVIATFLPLY